MSETSSITDVPGIRVGHAQDRKALTGCTVVLCEAGFTGGVDQRGGAPGTRETDLLRPMHLVEKVNAVLLTGGSAFGLDAAAGVMRFLEERGIGHDALVARVPIVPAAVLFDLGAGGDPSIRPDAAMGYLACENASADPPAQGNHGAGTGATVGKALGPAGMTKSGIGSASAIAWQHVRVAALIAANAFGEVVDSQSGEILAGARHPENSGVFLPTMQVLAGMAGKDGPPPPGENTVIGVVATNAALTVEQANKLAQMAHNGLARTIRPAHSMFDGDTIFALAGGDPSSPVSPMELSLLGEMAAETVARAVVSAVMEAESVAGIPSATDHRSQTTDRRS